MRAKLIPMPTAIRRALLDTLIAYDRGEDLTDSPLIQSGISYLHQDSIGKIDNPEVLLERQKKFIELYESIKANGYKEQPIWISWQDNGRPFLYDGFHRVAIMQHLNPESDIPVTTNWKGIDGQVGKGFPLVEVLMAEAPAGKALYQPVDQFSDWYVDRPDSPQRLEHILTQLTGYTVLDIGCSEGYFSRELAKRGYKVTAIDHSKGLIAAARYLNINQGLDIDFRCGDWHELIGDYDKYDNVLMLSVVHNDAKIHGMGRALQRLWALNGKCSRLLMEVPNMHNERQWNKKGFPNWDFHKLANIETMEVILGMSCIRDYLGNRSIFTFDREPSDLIVVDTVRKFPIICTKKEKFITDTFLGWHDWETETSNYIGRNLKSGQTFVDIGANGGYFTLLASRIVGDSGRVYAFEPAADTFKVLELNTQDLKNVAIYNMALSDHKGTEDFYGGPNTGQRGLSSTNITGDKILQKVTVSTLDSFNIKPDIIKIDTEGTEKDVIAGASKAITNDTILIVENGNNIDGFSIIGQSKTWRPFNFYLKKGECPTVYHILGLAHTKSNSDYLTCAITQNVVKMAKMLKILGYEAYHYGAEGSKVDCEHIDCISSADQQALYGDGWKQGFYSYNKNDEIYQKFDRAAIEEINKRKGPRDILLAFNGNAHKKIADTVGLTTVEASIGYEGVFTNKRVFESYAWMQYIYGALSRGKSASDGNFYDAVIPLAIDPKDFVYREKKEDYFLYAGRIIKRKGVHIAQQVCDKIGAKLIIIGQGKLEGVVDQSPNIEFRGSVGVKERAELMAGARAVFAPTIYLEPFGAVVPEANACGTPVITTDWGAFPETVKHGVTGYRCRTFDDFIWAAKNVDKLKPFDCRHHSMNYSLDNVALKYKEYFLKVRDLFDKGWYTERDRQELDWLK